MKTLHLSGPFTSSLLAEDRMRTWGRAVLFRDGSRSQDVMYLQSFIFKSSFSRTTQDIRSSPHMEEVRGHSALVMSSYTKNMDLYDNNNQSHYNRLKLIYWSGPGFHWWSSHSLQHSDWMSEMWVLPPRGHQQVVQLFIQSTRERILLTSLTLSRRFED